jgi:hypothetical protein
MHALLCARRLLDHANAYDGREPLARRSALVLDIDYYFPTVEISLDRDTSAMVRGVVTSAGDL